ncbi:hypothetical protein Salat_0296400 [Sesamum alatum]|uniref:Uncharacterized protein n=1 Tax=Sesamum alatum TaxID=300844 RepID=A0AAE1YZM4_9LAMI|nr:hypothetical protein Salat_0296400 [Sesamum alatum]
MRYRVEETVDQQKTSQQSQETKKHLKTRNKTKLMASGIFKGPEEKKKISRPCEYEQRVIEFQTHYRLGRRLQRKVSNVLANVLKKLQQNAEVSWTTFRFQDDDGGLKSLLITK